MIVRFPSRALPRRDFFHHLIDLLERQAFRLRDEEVRPENAQTAQPAPDEEHFTAQVAVGGVHYVGDYYAWDEGSVLGVLGWRVEGWGLGVCL